MRSFLCEPRKRTIAGLLVITMFTVFCRAQNLLNQNQTIIHDAAHNRDLLSNLGSGDIVQIDSTGTQSYFARNTGMDQTMSISGNVVYGTNTVDQRLRGYDLETGLQVLSVIVPGTTQLLHTSADSSGNIYIAQPLWDGGNNGRLMKFRISDGMFFTLSTSLPSDVTGIVYDGPNNRIVANTWSMRVVGIDLSSHAVTTLAITNLTANGLGIAKDKYGSFYTADCWWMYRFDPAFSRPAEMVYQSSCYDGGIAFIDYDATHNVIALPLQNCNSWDTLAVVPPVTSVPIDRPGTVRQNPITFAMHQAYPNPFNPGTTIRYDVPRMSRIRLEVFNVLGCLVRTLVDRTVQPGSYDVTWDGTDEEGVRVSSGVHFFRLLSDNSVHVQKAVLAK